MRGVTTVEIASSPSVRHRLPPSPTYLILFGYGGLRLAMTGWAKPDPQQHLTFSFILSPFSLFSPLPLDVTDTGFVTATDLRRLLPSSFFLELKVLGVFHERIERREPIKHKPLNAVKKSALDKILLHELEARLERHIQDRDLLPAFKEEMRLKVSINLEFRQVFPNSFGGTMRDGAFEPANIAFDDSFFVDRPLKMRGTLFKKP